MNEIEFESNLLDICSSITEQVTLILSLTYKIRRLQSDMKLNATEFKAKEKLAKKIASCNVDRIKLYRSLNEKLKIQNQYRRKIVNNKEFQII